MEQTAVNRKTIQVKNDQSYEWGIVETKFGKIRKYACIDYYWYGNEWARVLQLMKDQQMRMTAISFYKGAEIDMLKKRVTFRGEFPREYASDRHRFFWHTFFKCGEREEPEFITVGKLVKLPNVAGDNDSLNFYVNGENVNQFLGSDDMEAA